MPNKVDLSLTGLAPDKFKNGLTKVPIGEKVSEEILKNLNKSVTKKERAIINNIYPGASFSPNEPKRNFYEDLRNLYDPPDNYTIEERIMAIEDFFYSIIDEHIKEIIIIKSMKSNMRTLILRLKLRKLECLLKVAIKSINLKMRSSENAKLYKSLIFIELIGGEKEEVCEDYKPG